MAVLIRLAAERRRGGDRGDLPALCRGQPDQLRGGRARRGRDGAADARRARLHPWLVAEEDGRIVGYASTSPLRDRAAYRWTVETGIYLAADAQGRGLGRRLLSAHLDAARAAGLRRGDRRGSPCPTRPASRCTRSSASPCRGSSAASASSWADGSTSACGRRTSRRGPLRRPSRPYSSLRA